MKKLQISDKLDPRNVWHDIIRKFKEKYSKPKQNGEKNIYRSSE